MTNSINASRLPGEVGFAVSAAAADGLPCGKFRSPLDDMIDTRLRARSQC
jgi:hypothetical protein